MEGKTEAMTPDMNGPFDAAIAELETRIRNMQITLETLRQLRADGGGSTSSSFVAPAGSRGVESEVQHDTFFGMTIGEAARKYLGMAKHTKSTADIATALEMGGLKHASKDFHTTLRSTLGQKEEFLRVPNGDWGLAEWYPGLGRGKKTAPEKPSKRAVKQKAQAKPKAVKVQAGEKGADSGSTRRETILRVMRTDVGKDWTAGKIAKAANDTRKYIQAMMSGMAKDGEIAKSDKGYRLIGEKPQAA